MLDHVSREQLAALRSESKRLLTSETTVDRERGIAVSELVKAWEGNAVKRFIAARPNPYLRQHAVHPREREAR